MSLRDLYLTHEASLAQDGIPLHFGDPAAEYRAAVKSAILLDRSHEGRIELQGDDRFSLLQRMSTNDLLGMQPGEVRPTIFTNATARILDRVEVISSRDDSLLLVTGPGRAPAVRDYLQRNIFFNDKVRLKDLTTETHQFALHGPNAAEVVAKFGSDIAAGRAVQFDGAEAYVAPLKPLSDGHWIVIATPDNVEEIWHAIVDTGKEVGLKPSGGLIYNALRIRAGSPGVGRELTADYIPLELGLWDEVSFVKGCYTGQEIIARMESRQQLARILVGLKLTKPIDASATLYHEGRSAGTITSSVTAPDGEIFALAVVKANLARPELQLQVNLVDGPSAIVERILGIQPAWVIAKHAEAIQDDDS